MQARKVDTLTDAELEALTTLAGKDWLAGFDGAILPGRLQTMKTGENMRKILKTAAEVLRHDRAALTYALRKMRTTGNDAAERNIVQALDAGIQWAAGQAAMLTEARERMRCADARLKLTELEP